MSVVSIGKTETLLEFVERVGVVCAENVEMRFGMTNKDARRALRCLAREGKLIESGRFHRGDGVAGSRLEWRLP